MPSPVSHVGVVAKARLQAATPHLSEVESWLAERGVGAVFETATAALMPPAAGRRIAEKDEKIGAIVVFPVKRLPVIAAAADVVDPTRDDFTR